MLRTLWVPTPQNGQTRSNNSLVEADELFECVWPFCVVGAERVKCFRYYFFNVNRCILLWKYYLESENKMLEFWLNFTSFDFTRIFKHLVILFIVKLYARNNLFDKFICQTTPYARDVEPWTHLESFYFSAIITDFKRKFQRWLS